MHDETESNQTENSKQEKSITEQFNKYYKKVKLSFKLNVPK